jgi:hypothetical protein
VGVGAGVGEGVEAGVGAGVGDGVGVVDGVELWDGVAATSLRAGEGPAGLDVSGRGSATSVGVASAAACAGPSPGPRGPERAATAMPKTPPATITAATRMRAAIRRRAWDGVGMAKVLG